MLTVKKILAGRGAVDYYLNQTRRGLADYYVRDERAHSRGEALPLSAPASSWWGGGAEALELSGEVQRGDFVPLYTKAARPDGGSLGRRFRLPEEASDAKAAALRAVAEIVDPYERWLARHEIRRRAPHASVAAWDCTFSPPKSVSLLWAASDHRIQQQVWAAHLAAVDAGLGYLEDHAAYVRAGRNGVRVLDTSGLVVARMNEWTSRDGDMHLHTHCLVFNRAQAADDGKWRALDGRALLSARIGGGALYNRTLENELTRRLGVAWRGRPDGLRELDGVDDELIQAFSSRRRAITAAVEQLAAAYRDKYGIDAPRAVLSAMSQTAWAKTRQHKRDLEPDEALERWEATARRHGRQLAHLPARVLARAPQPPGDRTDPLERLVTRLADSGQATFTRHDLLSAALDVLPPGSLSPAQLRARTEQLVNRAVSHPELVGVSAPEVIDAPAELRRLDGSSVYEQPDRQRWALKATLDQEAWLLDVAAEATGRALDRDVIVAAVVEHDLGADQAAAVRELLGSQRRVGLLVGPAGAGKTRTLRAVASAWQHDGGDVVGLTVSQSAAGVLAEEAQVDAENIAKWLHETRRGRWRLPQGALVLVDEASMVATADLVELVEQARRAGGRVLLVGDPAQLSAIDIGGAFDLLADRHGAAHLLEVRRFVDAWEAEASLSLRRRDPAAISEYVMRGRIHAGTTEQVEAALFDAWRAEALSHQADGRRHAALMIVTTNEQAAVLSARARQALIDAGAVAVGATVRLRDNVASVGDHIVTRRNNRRLRTTSGGWVVNGDVWTVLAVLSDGAAQVRRHSDASVVTLPAAYLAEHSHLAYATTAHRAQGMTVDVCHAAITADTSHEQLYVAATRGRHANHLWVIADSDRAVHAHDDLPPPEQILSRILQRTAPDRQSAHRIIEDSLLEATSLARLGAIFEDAARNASDRWLRHTLTAHGLQQAVDDPEWASLITRAREAALAGHYLAGIVEEAITMRPIGDARSTAAVLHWRVDALAATPAPHPRGLFASLPPTDGPDIDIARQASNLIRQRWRDLRAALAATTEPLPWEPDRGARPTERDAQEAWLDAATSVAAYRERFKVPDHTPMLGPRPAASRADARAAWDHACRQADRYLSRRLRDLNDDQLAALDTRQKTILDNPPPFDPIELERARQSLDATQAAEQLHPGPASRKRPAVERLERAAQAHRDWRHHATEALALRRQVAFELQRRQRERTLHHPVRLAR